MIKIENVEVYGWEAAIRGMRNPKNSWNKSDSDCTTIIKDGGKYIADFIGENDLKLMKALAGAGTDHGKFLRMITVTLDITAPLYWWKEFDTYKVGTVADSCSTMHKIQEKEFTVYDFSHEHLFGVNEEPIRLCFNCKNPPDPFDSSSIGCMKITVSILNYYRQKFLKTQDKNDWWQMIQLLPSSYNQKRTVLLNYAVLKNMYHARKNHKLDEWVSFCKWVETLPYSELICENWK